jgi:hypothetical protein
VTAFDSLECRILGAIGRALPEGSGAAEILSNMLESAPEQEAGEAAATADLHSVVYAALGVVALLVGIGLDAALDTLAGHTASRRAGAVLFAPVAFFMSLALLIQLAKYRRRFQGIQPVLGRASWFLCFAMVLFVVLSLGVG